MAADYLRLLREALERSQRISQPAVRPNRTLLTFQRAQDLVVLNNELTVSASGVVHPAQWGTTTNGPNGGNWQWNLTVWG